MKKTLRIVPGLARLGPHPGKPTLYHLCGARPCEVVERDPLGGEVVWPEKFEDLRAAEGAIHQLARPKESHGQPEA